MRRFIRLIIALSITIGVSGITGRSVRATEYQVNRMDKQQTSLVLSSGWQVIKTENFEAWPTSGWSVVDLSNDGYDRRWDSHTYKYHTGARAIWPARGLNGRIPVPGYDDYFNNMNTRMTYGPFDLSDARQAEVRFWLWIDTQPTYDYLALEVSTTSSSSGFQEIARWSGSATSWQEQVIPLDNFLGYSSVWIAWRFYSNSSTVADGPWVDDVLLRKYVAGQVTPQGTFSYYNRNSSLVGARYTKVSLFESDPVGGDDLLATTNTDANGFFQFPVQDNWDGDDSDPNPFNRKLDLYVIGEILHADSVSAQRQVTYFSGQTYKWQSFTSSNSSDGIVNLSWSIASTSTTRRAMWIFQDLRNAWEYVHNHTAPQFDPGSVIARWQYLDNCFLLDQWICSSFFYGIGIGGPFIFIKYDSSISGDTVVHEVAHNYLYNATGWWWWDPDCWNHDLFVQIDSNCAWSEGWGDFFALDTNGDTCYDYGIGPCGAGMGAFYDLEAIDRNYYLPNYPWGDAVEGRVAGALYDLLDTANESYDSAIFGFDSIADIVFQGISEPTFNEFWNAWKISGLNKHHAVRAIYQNTIDFDSTPQFDPPVDDQVVLLGISNVHAIDLWAYSTDNESSDAELTYQITSVTDPQCGISVIDGHWISIVPQPGWLGYCDATVQVNDSLKTSIDTFLVTVVPIARRIYLPIVGK